MAEEDTMKFLEERLKGNPQSLLFARLADIYIRKGRIDDAINLCLQGIQYHPYYITGNFMLGKAYDAKGDTEKAEAEYKKVLSHDKQYMSAHKALGDMMLAMGWEDKAALHYKEILRIDPLEEEVRELLNSFSFESGSSDEMTFEDQKGKINFKPLFETKTEFEQGKDWGKELEEIFTEDEKQSVTESPTASQEKINDELGGGEKIIEMEEETLSNRVDAEDFHVGDSEQEGMGESITTETELHEREDLAFHVSEEAGEENMKERPLISEKDTSITDAFTLDLEKVKGGEENVEPQVASLPYSEITEETGFEVKEESEKGKEKETVSPPTLKSEFQTGEEEFSFDFQQEEREKGEDESLSPPFVKTEKPKKVEESDLSIKKDLPDEKVKEVEKAAKVIPLKMKKEPIRKLRSDRFQEMMEMGSDDKGKTAASSKKVEKKIEEEYPEHEDSGKKEEEKGEKIISPTLGEIYKAQGQYAKAIRIYETLLKKNPSEKRYQEQINELKQKLKG